MQEPRNVLTRRAALFGLFARPAASSGAAEGGGAAASPPSARVAVVQGRACLAYRALTCSVCVERCPEEGALVREGGLPRIVSDLCTGCGVCRDVCPAPRNAILLVERRPGAPR